MPTRLTDADRWLGRWVPAQRTRCAISVAFLASATLQIVGVPFTSSFGTRTRIDLDVYRIGAQIWQQGQSLYADGSMPFTSDGIWLPFTYPPFAALTFVPLGAMPLQVAGVIMSVVTIALTVAIVHLFLSLLSVGNRANRWWLALAVATGVVWFNPVWMTLGFGQINIVLMALIVADVFLVGQGRLRRLAPARGVLVGLAAAIKLTPLVFIVVFAVRGRWRAVATAVATFVAAGLLAWIWLPSDSFGYWTHTLFHTTRIGDPAGRINQNLNAMGIRLVPDSTTVQLVTWVLSSLAATALATVALRACRPREAFARGAGRHARVNAVLTICTVAVWGLLVSPTSWAHHWVWSIPLILAAATVAARSANRATQVGYGAVAISGTLIFALGPFQFLSSTVRQWSVLDHIVGNAYTLWGIAALVIIWRFPFTGDGRGRTDVRRPVAHAHSA
ncbi:alpha-(1-2)-phosphatidylinositol mannoside mannosyltransferase [Gordonia sinesedis]